MKGKYLLSSARSVLCVALAFAALGLLSQHAAAAAPPAVTLASSVTNANGSLTTRLTWSTSPVATSCTAGGHALWTGTKPASGSLDLPAITMSGTYQLTLSCSWAGDNGAVLSWTAPTQNTDGSALANLAGYRIYRAATAAAAATVTPADKVISNPATLSYTYAGLPTGPQFYALASFNALGVESARTAAGFKESTAGTVTEKRVAITVNPVPKAPVLSLDGVPVGQ